MVCRFISILFFFLGVQCSSLSSVFAEEPLVSEELAGVPAIYGAYDVSSTNEDVREDAIAYDALLPFLNEEKRDLLPEHPFTGHFLIVDRRSDRHQTISLSEKLNTVTLANTPLHFTLHQCVKNARDIEGNDVAFLHIGMIDGQSSETILEKEDEDLTPLVEDIASSDEDISETVSLEDLSNPQLKQELFSGWLYKLYPSVNVFVHPVYSVKFLGCDAEDAFDMAH